MTRVAGRRLRGTLLLLVAWLVLGCEPDSNDPQVIDSQTNWLSFCQIDAQCGSRQCICGVCTSTCITEIDCADLKGTACVAADDIGAIAQCGGGRMPGPGPGPGLCLPRCSDAACAKGQMCVAGVCTPVPTPTARVQIDPRARHQVLTGFGATVAYYEEDITTHPRKDALDSALFADLGLDVLRFRNRYGHTGEDDLGFSKDLLDAAKASLGRTPTIFMTSWSPPPALKANGAIACSGNPDTCMLTKTPAGSFDYPAFAAYWRSSLDAYATAGVVPDYIGIQNNPNWVPSFSESGEACKFLPVEGTTTVFTGGKNVTVRYPGFAQAQAATLAAFAGASSVPKVLAPETSDVESVAGYLATLDTSTLSAVSHHLYGVNPEMVNLSSLRSVGDLTKQDGMPIFQTEMTADGFGTALLIHYTTTVEGASAYLQQSLASAATGPATNRQALVGLTDRDFTLQEPYYSLRHFARYTDPGWVRIDASSSSESLLVSSWQSPDEAALAVVLVNASTFDVDAKLELETGSWPATSQVIRTVFGGVERTANLGSLSAEGILRVPGRAIATIAFSK
jgi:glucuronoarabinoxylan endo-1,4-beta-xylanase